MSRSLVIVESPAKAKTINHYLGSEYIVKASMGHVRDLPKSKMGVDVEHDFEPTYQIIPDKKKVVAELKKLAAESESIILAADPDREGEAISWHLSELIGAENPKIFRAVFNEITKDGIKKAFEHLGGLDMPKIEAQQTRRILDRLVGYLISPLLWKKIGRGLSAGRVQSVALRLICDREKEIRAFVPEEYWNVSARLRAANPPDFKAALAKIDGKKAKVANKEQADAILEACKKAALRPRQDQGRGETEDAAPALHHELAPAGRLPAPPLSGQEDDVRRPEALRGPGDRRARADGAHHLHEDRFVPHLGRGAGRGPVVHRADLVPGLRPGQAQRLQEQEEGPGRPRGHPPGSPRPAARQGQGIPQEEEYDLYKLIWNRFIASQMAPAVVEETDFDIRSANYLFKAKGEVLKFDGFLAVAPNGNGDKDILPKAFEGEVLALVDGEAGLEAKQSFTQRPARYTEGTLVKELEAKGIGRPSTYAPIIATLQNRVYVSRDKGKFIPTELGMVVTEFLVTHFPELLDVTFTARMEEELDQIGDGERAWLESLREYYAVLDKSLKAGGEAEDVKRTGIPIEEKCPKCGKDMVIKSGRFGRFKACSGYPECTHKEALVKKETKPLDEKCPQCGAPLVIKFGRFGSFIACSSYPKCKYIQKDKVDTGIACPEGCGGTLVRRKTRRGKYFFGCSLYPKCKYATWDEPVAKACPMCGRASILKKNSIKGDPYLYCPNEKCTYKEIVPREKLWEQDKEGPSAPPADEKSD